MELAKIHFIGRVGKANGESIDVGPFESQSEFLFERNGAIDWIYLQIGMLKTRFHDAVLVKHRWNYREGGTALFSHTAVVDVKVEIAGFTFETVQLKAPNFAHVVEQVIEPASEQ